MPMVRSVALSLVILCAAFLGVGTPTVFAQDAVSTPEPCATFSCPPHLVTGASRYLSNLSQDLNVLVVALVFDSDTSASEGLQVLATGLRDSQTDEAVARSASTGGTIGDETFALSWKSNESPGSVAGAVLWRDGSLVYTLMASSSEVDPFDTVLDLSVDLVGRTYHEGTATEPDTWTRMRSGDVWDLLPTLDDLPAGYVFEREDLIEPDPVVVP